MMQVTPKGTLEICEHEGIVLGPYLDSVNVWTYGVGHTAAAGGLDPGKMEKVDTRSWDDKRVREELLTILAVFDDDLEKYEARVNKAVKVKIKPYQFDALVSFDFNTGGIFKAILTKLLNQKKWDEAGQNFMGWLRPKEIEKRRKAEMNLFMTGNYDANGSNITVWDSLPDGRMKHRGVLDSRQLSSLMKAAGAGHDVESTASKIWGWVKSPFKNVSFAC